MVLHSRETSLNFQLRLKSLVAVGLELARSTTLDDLCRQAVELGRTRLGFDRLSLWFFEGNTQTMRGSYGTDEHGNLRDERSLYFHLDEDSPMNAVLHSPDEAVVRMDTRLFDDRSQVVGTGWSAVAVLRDGDQGIGWLSADNLLNKRPLETYEPELLAVYGATIGHLVNRRRAEEALHRREEEDRLFQEKLRNLHDITIELSRATTFDDLCYRAIDLGRTRLGFDRLGLWFFDTDPNFMLGSYGTAEDGSIRDERSQRVPSKFSERLPRMGGSVLVSPGDNRPLYNHQREVVGYGWNAIAQVWNGDQSMGWLTTDNFFSHGPMTDYVLELMALYAATIGHLTRAMKARDALAKERNLLRTIIDTVPDFIYVKDRDARFMLVNRASWEAVEGIASQDDFIGRSDFDIFADRASQFYADDRRVLDEGISILNQEEDGTYPRETLKRTLLTTKAPLFDEQDRIIGLVGVTRDVTEFKRMEQRALNMEVERVRFAMLQEFITSITHDLRTPLANINTSLYILGRATDPQKQAAHLESIKKQVAHLDHIIQDILTIARLDNMPEIGHSPVNMGVLVDTLRENIDQAFEHKNIAFEIHETPGLPYVHGDGQELFPAMLHLVHNALQYTDAGGRVALHTYQAGEKFVFEVRDTGIGISPADLPHIFERFYRADKARSMEKGGSGLGLSIVRKIVEMHGGTIEVNSSVGQGSTFRILLPLPNST